MLTSLIGPQPWYVWAVITVICIGGAVLLILPAGVRSYLWAWTRFSVTWKQVAWAATVVVLLQFVTARWDAVLEFSDWARGFLVIPVREVNVDHLRTRPVCESECENFAFRVRDCEVAAVDAGGLASFRIRGERPVFGDQGFATEYFRGCLLDRGLLWESCMEGEDECRLLRTFTVYSNYTIPSFLD